MIKEEPIYVTGHLHPDTDSVASAIAYAFFKRAMGIKAIPCRLGKLNSESKYLLDRFGFEPPMLLEDARKTLAEIEIDSPISLRPDDTIYEAILEMDKYKRPSLAIVDENNVMLGMISKSDLADLGLRDTALTIDLLKETTVEEICSTIDGTIVYDDPQPHINGKVSIIALSSSRLEHYELKDRIVIVGDDADAQIEGINRGAGMLIVVWAEKIEDRVIEAAKANHCPIVISGHGSMNTSRYIYFAPPVRLVMNKKPIRFQSVELVEDAGKKMMQTRFRSYPVVDTEGKLVGYVSRYHLLNYKNKKIILVDHNEFSQSVRSIEKAQLLEVIDHHRINDFTTDQPVSFRNEIVGSSATIVATMFRENQIPIPANLAGLLLGAILSDTLMFESPTTTPKDKVTANILAALADLDIETFGNEMFSAQAANTEKADIAKLINTDIKYYDIRTCKTMISQVIVTSTEDAIKRQYEIQRICDELTAKKGLDLLVVAFTSVMERGSVFFAAGEKAAWIKEAFPDDFDEEGPSIQKGVLSRKSQILPRITEVVSKYA